MLKKQIAVAEKLVLALVVSAAVAAASAQNSPSPLPRSVPARTLPVPSDVSVGMQQIIARR